MVKKIKGGKKDSIHVQEVLSIFVYNELIYEKRLYFLVHIVHTNKFGQVTQHADVNVLFYSFVMRLKTLQYFRRQELRLTIS